MTPYFGEVQNLISVKANNLYTREDLTLQKEKLYDV